MMMKVIYACLMGVFFIDLVGVTSAFAQEQRRARRILSQKCNPS